VYDDRESVINIRHRNNKMKNPLQALTVLLVLLLFPVIAAALGLGATEPISSEERSLLNPSRDVLNRGMNVANSDCAGCHGTDGASTGPGVPNLAGQRLVYLHRVLQSYQERGRHNDAMNHATYNLSNEALNAVAAYYASLPPARPAAWDDESAGGFDINGGDPFAGIREDMKKCVKCHGEDGNASASGMPNLTAQDPEYFVASMQTYAADGRGHKLMGKLAAGLDEETLYKMAVFYAVQEPARTQTAGDGNADLGRELSEPCASCHGDDGNASGASMPTLAGQDARYFIKAMDAYKEGKRQHEGMFGAVDPLSEDDVVNLAAFYAGQDPVRRNVRTPLTTGEWINRCERCHGIDGNSTDPRFPMLAGQERQFLANALQAYIGASRSNSTMHAMSDPLSESDIERIVEYYATREPKSVVYMQLPCEEPADE
jgi:cytochrome c553